MWLSVLDGKGGADFTAWKIDLFEIRNNGLPPVLCTEGVKTRFSLETHITANILYSPIDVDMDLIGPQWRLFRSLRGGDNSIPRITPISAHAVVLANS